MLHSGLALLKPKKTYKNLLKPIETKKPNKNPVFLFKKKKHWFLVFLKKTKKSTTLFLPPFACEAHVALLWESELMQRLHGQLTHCLERF